MKEHDVKLTLQEAEQLCRLYMDCRRTVLEETELQYVLGKLPYSSPCIDEARLMMGLTIPPEAFKNKKKAFSFFGTKAVINIAASFAILFSIGIAMVYNPTTPSTSSSSNDNTPVYVAAYNHGKRLNESEALYSTNAAIAKADSLMEYASLTERDHMMKANDIISVTIKN